MANPLDIPGLGGFLAMQQMNRQREGQDMQAVQRFRTMEQEDRAIAQQQQAAAQAAAYKSAIEALGPDASEDAVLGVVKQYAPAPDLLKTLTASRDRQATIEATNATREATLQQQATNSERMHAERMARLATDAEKVAETKRHNTAMEGIQRQLAEIRGEAAKKPNVPKPPPGYRYKADTDNGELEPIPGGPKDSAAKDAARAQMARQKADIVIKKVDEALANTGFFSTGLTGAIMGKIPGTSAFDLDRTIDTIKAQLGFAELQAMRDASPTGGALGQVAVQELNMLQSTLASLDKGQSQEQITRALKQVKQHFENWKKAVEQAGAEGGASTPPPGAPNTPQPAAAANPREVALPNGRVMTFPTPAAAAEFRKKAGL